MTSWGLLAPSRLFIDKLVELRPTTARLISPLVLVTKDVTSTLTYALAVVPDEFTPVLEYAGAFAKTIPVSLQPPEVVRTEKPADNALVVYTFNTADFTLDPLNPDAVNRR
jgi:hypothetical protein